MFYFSKSDQISIFIRIKILINKAYIIWFNKINNKKNTEIRILKIYKIKN